MIQALHEKLKTHKQSQFTGIVYVGVGQSLQWALYFNMGRMVWAHSQVHPIRRWHRQLVKHYPQLIAEMTPQNGEKEDIPYAKLKYQHLALQVRQDKINRTYITKAVEDYLTEIMFDIVHQGTLRFLHAKSPFVFTDSKKKFSSSLFLVVQAEQAWQQAQADWQAWQQAELVKCSPNLAPFIGQPQELKKLMPRANYNHLRNIIDGQQTFRDIAVALNQPYCRSCGKLCLIFVRV